MMIDVTLLTNIHTALSFLGLALGIPATMALCGKPIKPIWTTWFLVTAVAVTATGFIFPLTGMTPAVGVGLITTGIFGLMIIARKVFHNQGLWKLVYDLGIFINFYFLVFVGIAQSFQKIPFIHDLAPTQAEPPFAIAQIIAFGIFVLLGKKVVRHSRKG